MQIWPCGQKKSREKLCPIRTRAAKKVIKEGVCNEYLHSWDQRKALIKSLDQAAGKRDISREEYLRQCLERIAYDDRALENRYVQQLQKLTSCIQQQQNQLNILTDSIKEIAEYTIQKESEFEG